MSGGSVDKASASISGVEPPNQVFPSNLRLPSPQIRAPLHLQPAGATNHSQYIQYMRSIGASANQQPPLFPPTNHMASGGGLLTNALPLSARDPPFGVIKQGLGPLNIHRDARHDLLPNMAIVNHSNAVNNHTLNADNGQVEANATTPGGQRLKVEDALSYLDQVKLQFGSRPQVYSDFLDIMKDFKSQSIDTPGVIQRVSNLFRGHPSLIVGFNTFLPPGYKIQVDGEKGERVSICTPSGTSQIITTMEKENTTTENGSLPVPVMPVERPQANSHPEAPMEFNNAIVYVNKIKSRFSNKPEVYKSFLEILHQYQKEQREIKSGHLAAGHKPLTENQVYASVAKLFTGESDLLMEFSQFLPEATNVVSSTGGFLHAMTGDSPTTVVAHEVKPHIPKANVMTSMKVEPPPKGVKRPVVTSPKGKEVLPSVGAGSPPFKKPKKIECHYDVSICDASKYGTLQEFQFFDKVRKALKNETVYENFLRCLLLFNQGLISKADLINLLHPFLGKFPELLLWMKDFLGCSDRVGYMNVIPVTAEQHRISSDLAMEIDYASCKRHGVSYRALPHSYAQPVCCGRDELCKEVLNDTWVSFPSWSSEDTSNVSSKKTQYEEFIYRVEDERFELDMVIEANRYAMHTLEVCQRRLNKMNTEDAKKFTLGPELGGSSEALMLRAIRRIYGDKAPDLVDGLRRNPVVAVPLVLKRLKAKDDEWREAQRSFNLTWREQNEKYYIKSLDHQGMTFKQTDFKQIRAKTLLNQIETLFDERQEKQSEGGPPISDPHMQLNYPQDTRFFYDANDLIIHHVKRQTGIQKDEKCRVKRILKHVVPDLFNMEREELSDDEDEKDEDSGSGNGSCSGNVPLVANVNRRRRTRSGADRSFFSTPAAAIAEPIKNEPKVSCGYSLFLTPSSWYVFIRLHNLLCERLAKLKEQADKMIEEKNDSPNKPKSAAQILKCLPKTVCPPEQAYNELVEQVKNLLDGQVDATMFEDSLRDIFTTQAYLAFTMDRLIHAIVRQLQIMVTEELSVSLLTLRQYWSHKGATGGFAGTSTDRQLMQAAYQNEAEKMVFNDNLFKIYIMESGRKVSIELLDTESGDDDVTLGRRRKWSQYVSRFVKDKETILDKVTQRPPFLLRNISKKFDVGRSDSNEDLDASTSSDHRSESVVNGASASDLIVHENLQINFKQCNYRMRYVPGTEDVQYKRGTSANTKKNHESWWRRHHSRFQDWWLGWADVHVNEKDPSDWLLGDPSNDSRRSTVCKEQAFPNDFPYLTVTKYRRS